MNETEKKLTVITLDFLKGLAAFTLDFAKQIETGEALPAEKRPTRQPNSNFNPYIVDKVSIKPRNDNEKNRRDRSVFEMFLTGATLQTISRHHSITIDNVQRIIRFHQQNPGD
jgi:hypothetical protein